MALYHFTTRPLARSSRNTVDALAYRAGCKLHDVRTGESFDYRDKAVQHVELLFPQDAPQWAKNIQELIKTNRQEGVQALCNRVEAAEKRIDARIWREFEFSLHRELTEEQNMILAREFVQDQLCSRGILAQLNFHFEVDKKTGEYNPHCHVATATRRLEDDESSPTGFSAKKERDWDKKEHLCELREQWAQYSNFYLKLYGYDIQIDHRSHKERGIEMEPQPKRGKNVLEIERKAAERGTRENSIELPDSAESIKPPSLLDDFDFNENTKTTFVTDKMRAFQSAQLRNLYRIIKNPDVVLEIVTKHHATFIWADVQKKLHQYVDNAHLFSRLEAKLKRSNELILLRKEEVKNGPGIVQEEAIYTTRRMLKAERDLIEQAEGLGRSKTHSVQERHVEAALAKANEDLSAHGGLSQDQIKAIHHLVEEGQLKCMVGIAGAGKTAALGVCQKIWKAEWYAVYGLAPTGKAAQNLEQNEIQSQTLHKFLKSFEEGRCHYKENSILILDEAGMVDSERFGKLLGAVKHLGVKLVVVGDGAQLQPVEAGPAFRLVTTRLGKAELNTVVRQKEDWQREATVLFGKQETQRALQAYADKGCVHIVHEKLPSLGEALFRKNYEDVIKLYEVSHRVSSLIYREMAKTCPTIDEEEDSWMVDSLDQKELPPLHVLLMTKHQDYGRYKGWKEMAKITAKYILHNAESCRPFLEERCIDTFPLALLCTNRDYETAEVLLKDSKLDHLIGIEKRKDPKRKTIDVRETTKEELIRSWHSDFKKAFEEHNLSRESLILAYSNKDVNDLNKAARVLLKESGHISTKEFVYQTKKQVEDDFGRKTLLTEEKRFSKGDRIVFTRNNDGLGVKNGTTGTITNLNTQKIHVKLDDEKEISGKELAFASNLNPYFDHGWALTIHKSQGTTVDYSYVLASYEMTQNLAYVAMTRHREGVKVFGSSLDFWRPEKLPEVLSKSGEKLSAADYLDATSLSKLMESEDRLLTHIFEGLSNKLEAIEVVSKKAFWKVAEHFLGISREREIRLLSESVREEVRAEEFFKKESPIIKKEDTVTQKPHSTTVQFHPQLQPLSTNGALQIDSKREKVISSPPLKESVLAETSFKEPPLVRSSVLENPLSKGVFVETSLAENTSALIQISEKVIQKKFAFHQPPNKEIVEEALKANMADFADHIFTSIGEDYNRAMSSRTERRYGKKGEFAVNIQKGVWLSYKDSQLAGGPLHLLTKLKDLSYQEAIEYGTSWARLSPEQLTIHKKTYDSSYSQKKNLEKETQEIKQKIKRAQSLYAKGLPIQGTLAERYLREHRKIQGNLPKDLLYLPSNQMGKSSLPALMSVARSNEGDVTAVQLTFLDPTTANKANIPVQKKSFGSIKGAAVTIQACPHPRVVGEHEEPAESSNLLFIAEGVETALSVKEADIKGTIKASLGLSNIKRLQPEDINFHIILCGDHDAPESSATKSLQKSAQVLQERGYKVTIIKPDKLGEDFNDVLKVKSAKGIKEILTKNLPKDFLTSMETSAEKQPQKNSHTRGAVEKKEAKQPLKSERETPAFTLAGKSFQDIAAYCEKRLHDALARDKKPLTKERTQRFPLQAERIATFLIHAYEHNGPAPTQEEVSFFSLRAKYELNRIPEIRKELIKKWKDKDSFKENEGLRAHMIAERLASIEGRLYLKTKQDGTKVPSNIAELAHQKLKKHRAYTPKLAEELSQKYLLSQDIATYSAKDILRYKETHGELPSESQIANIVQIAQKLRIKDYASTLNKKFNRLEADYLQRYEGDLLFKHMSCQKHTDHDAHFFHIQNQSKKSLEILKSEISNEKFIKMNEKEFFL